MGGGGAQGEVVQGNYVGTDITGMHLIANGSFGISVGDADAAAQCRRHGTAAGAGNVVEGDIIFVGDSNLRQHGAGQLRRHRQDRQRGPQLGQVLGIYLDQRARRASPSAASAAARARATSSLAASAKKTASTSMGLANGNTIQGNFVGVSPSGASFSPHQGRQNPGDGIYVATANNTIGGLAAGRGQHHHQQRRRGRGNRRRDGGGQLHPRQQHLQQRRPGHRAQRRRERWARRTRCSLRAAVASANSTTISGGPLTSLRQSTQFYVDFYASTPPAMRPGTARGRSTSARRA